MTLLRFHITWDINDDIDLYLTDRNGKVIWDDDKTSSLGELDIDNGAASGGTGTENITLKQLVPGKYKKWANCFRDWYPGDYSDGVVTEDDPSVVTPVDVEMETYHNSSTLLNTDVFQLWRPSRADVNDLPTNTPGRTTLPSWYVRKVVTVNDNGVVTQHQPLPTAFPAPQEGRKSDSLPIIVYRAMPLRIGPSSFVS